MATVRTLLVGGGGGGGQGGYSGGGGGGRVLYDPAFVVTAQAYTITVGAGGALNTQGGSSIFDTLTAIGGGKGGVNGVGGNGACGGGGGTFGGTTEAGGTGSFGGNGGTSATQAGGGGGGMSGNGSNGSSTTGGNGANGVTNDISGSSVYYGGGGGGAGQNAYGNGGLGGGGHGGIQGTSTPAVAGTANTGGGGGGGGTGFNGGIGGSGIVIIRYVTADFGTCTGGVITTDGSDTIHTFLTSGTFTVAFNEPPDVETNAVTSILVNSAIANGEVTNDKSKDVLSRGFVYSTSSHSDPSNTAPEDTDYEFYIEENGTFSQEAFIKGLTNLDENTTYYVRAFANNIIGYTYGDEVYFTTEYEPPTITEIIPAGSLLNTETAFTIYGTNFRSGLSLEIDGETCTDIVFVDSETITAVCPVSEISKVSILIIENPDTKQISSVFYYMEEIPEQPTTPEVSAIFSVKGIGIFR